MSQNVSKGSPNQRLREERLHHGWSQQEVADLLGTTTNNVSRWELGQTIPGPYFRTKLCDLFGKSAQELRLRARRTDFTNNSEHIRQVQKEEKVLDGEVVAPRWWYVPFQRDPLSGRDVLPSKLHGLFRKETDSVHIVTLFSMGKSGKTKTAIEYAYRFRADYQAIFWLHAASQSLLLEDIRTLARILRLPEKDDYDQRVVIAIKRWLTDHARWLLILEDVEDTAMLANVLPSEGTGDVLLTT